MTKTKGLHKKQSARRDWGKRVVLFLMKVSQFSLSRRTKRILVESGATD